MSSSSRPLLKSYVRSGAVLFLFATLSLAASIPLVLCVFATAYVAMKITLIVLKVKALSWSSTKIAFELVFFIGSIEVFLIRWLKRPDRREGVLLDRSAAPLFFEDLDTLVDESTSVKVDAVWITHDLNASAAGYLRKKYWPFSISYELILGLPLLNMLEREEAISVIAHELGHFQKGHSAWQALNSRIENGWLWKSLLGYALPSDSPLGRLRSMLVSSVYNLYCSESRSEEYEADKFASQTVRVGSLLTALAKLELAEELHVLERRWYALRFMVEEYELPPEEGDLQLFEPLWVPYSEEFFLQRLQAKPRNQQEGFATHPSFAERIGALTSDLTINNQIAAKLADPSSTSSAQYWFHACPADLKKKISLDWCLAFSESWHRRHGALQLQAVRLKLFEEMSPIELSPDQLFQYVLLIDKVGVKDDRLNVVNDAIQVAPSHLGLSFYLAALLLDEDFEKARGLVARVAARKEASSWAFNFRYLMSRLNDDDLLEMEKNLNRETSSWSELILMSENVEFVVDEYLEESFSKLLKSKCPECKSYIIRYREAANKNEQLCLISFFKLKKYYSRSMKDRQMFLRQSSFQERAAIFNCLTDAYPHIHIRSTYSETLRIGHTSSLDSFLESSGLRPL